MSDNQLQKAMQTALASIPVRTTKYAAADQLAFCKTG
jgi:hypothetical protein